MQKKYKVRLTTKTGKVYSFDWTAGVSSSLKVHSVSELFFQADLIIVKESEGSETIVPTHAICEITFKRAHG